MGKVLAGAGGFCGACGTAAATGTGPCGSREARAARAEVDGGVRGSESRVPRGCGCGSSKLGLSAEAGGLRRGDPSACSEPASVPPATHPDPSEAPWLSLLRIPWEPHVTSLLTSFPSASLVPRYPGPPWRSFLPASLGSLPSLLALSVSALFSSLTPASPVARSLPIFPRML